MLPIAPSCASQIKVPPLKAGVDARQALAERIVALRKANRNLSCFNVWYAKVRGTYAKK